MTTRRFVETGSNLLDRDITIYLIDDLGDKDMEDAGIHAIPTRWYHRQLDKMLVSMHKYGINLKPGNNQDEVIENISEFKQKLRDKEREIDEASKRKILRMRNPIVIDCDAQNISNLFPENHLDYETI
jgi:hypothetical protein